MLLLLAAACQPHSRLYSARSATLPNGTKVTHAAGVVFIGLPDKTLIRINTETGAILRADSTLNYKMLYTYEN